MDLKLIYNRVVNDELGDKHLRYELTKDEFVLSSVNPAAQPNVNIGLLIATGEELLSAWVYRPDKFLLFERWCLQKLEHAQWQLNREIELEHKLQQL